MRAYFPFYPADWLTDPKVRLMTLEQRGAYIDLLAISWREGPLPADPLDLAGLVGADPEAFGRDIWPRVSCCWIQTEAGLVNPRLEREREQAMRRREAYIRGGERTATERWGTPTCPEHDCAASTAYTKRGCRCEVCRVWKSGNRGNPVTKVTATGEKPGGNRGAEDGVVARRDSPAIAEQPPGNRSSSSSSSSSNIKHTPSPAASGSDDPQRPAGYSTEFERVWKKYPEREGSNPKRAAFQAWRARLREKIDPGLLERAVEHYAASVRREGSAYTRYVMQASTFFGPNERWKEYTDRDGPAAKVAHRTCNDCGDSKPEPAMLRCEYWWLCHRCARKYDDYQALVTRNESRRKE